MGSSATALSIYPRLKTNIIYQNKPSIIKKLEINWSELQNNHLKTHTHTHTQNFATKDKELIEQPLTSFKLETLRDNMALFRINLFQLYINHLH